MTDEKLFNEFAPIPTEKWEEIINKDLKGADYEKKLVWRTDEGFKVRPYYRAEDLQDIDYLNVMPNEFPFTRSTKADANNWEIVQNITETQPAKANEIALASIKGGATTLCFDMREVKTAEDFGTLLAGLDLSKVGVQFTRPQGRAIELMKLFLGYLSSQNIDKAVVGETALHQDLGK